MYDYNWLSSQVLERASTPLPEITNYPNQLFQNLEDYRTDNLQSIFNNNPNADTLLAQLATNTDPWSQASTSVFQQGANFETQQLQGLLSGYNALYENGNDNDYDDWLSSQIFNDSSIPADENLINYLEQLYSMFVSDDNVEIDNAGNTPDNARQINVSSTPSNFVDSVNENNDTDDYYRFTLNETSNLTLSLTGLSSDADVELLDSSSNNLNLSEETETSDESIT